MAETREEFTMDKEEAEAVCGGFSGSNELQVVSDVIIDHKRWTVVHDIVVKRASDGKFFKIRYYANATESQDEDPFAYSAPVFREVFPIERLTTVFE